MSPADALALAESDPEVTARRPCVGLLLNRPPDGPGGTSFRVLALLGDGCRAESDTTEAATWLPGLTRERLRWEALQALGQDQSGD